MSVELHLALAEKARAARTIESLGFVCCNETHALMPYRQAALVAYDSLDKTALISHSGLATVDGNAPFGLWLREVAAALKPQLESLPEATPLVALSPESLPAPLATAWQDWLPSCVWALPLAGPDGKLRAVLFIARDEPWPDEIQPGSPAYWLLATVRVYGHAWWALSARGLRITERAMNFWHAPRTRKLLPWLALILLFPVREYSLAPAEVVSLTTQVIASPQDGVIRRMVVSPNAAVKAGDVLAELDHTTLHNRVAVARASLDTARADFLQASQRAFDRQDAKAEIGMTEGRLREREAELASLAEELARLQIQAPGNGVFVYSNPDDWAGKPVQTGERIGMLADPAVLGVQVWVPVGEAINLKAGAPITLFLRVAPLSPISARLDYASYQVIDSPDGIASYRVRGSMTETSAAARVGLRGTARIGGDWTVLGYLFLRRPLALLREWCGC